MTTNDQTLDNLTVKKAFRLPQNLLPELPYAGLAFNTTNNIPAYSNGLEWIDLASESDPLQYDAIVSPGGANGTYPLISSAIADGKTNIFVKSGTYVETSSITIPNGTTIMGQKASNTIVIFSGLATPGFIADGTGGIVQTAGTISINNGTNTVNGVGTAFLTLSVGNIILLGGVFYTIATITSNVLLTVSEVYRGRTLAGKTYIAFPFLSAIRIEELTLQNSAGTSSAISFTGISRLLLRSLAVVGFVNNILINTCNVVLLDLVLSRSSAGTGITFTRVYNSAIHLSGSANNTTHGVALTDVFNVIVDQCFLSNNGSRGIDIGGSSSVVNFTNTILEYNMSDGIRTSVPTSNILLSQCNVDFNNDGVNFAGTQNSLVDCIITNNVARGIQTGDNGLVSGCHVASNGTIGIDMGSDDNNTITANSVHNNGTDGISISGNTQNSAITGNTVYLNGASGINIGGNAAGDNVVSGNTISDNTTNGIRVLSDDNVITGNRISGNSVGVLINATADRTIVSVNNIRNNTTAISGAPDPVSTGNLP